MNDISKSNARNIYLNSFWFSIKDMLVTSFLSVYLLRLHANNFQLSLYEAIPAGVTIITLLLVSTHLNNSRKHFVNAQAADRFGFFVFAVLLFLVKSPLLIIILFGLYTITFSICTTLSGNYVKESVPKESWGSVFSKNKMILVFVGMLTLLAVGRLLDKYNNNFPYNFIWIFFVVGILYTFSFNNMRKIKADVKETHWNLGRVKMLMNIDKRMLTILLTQAAFYTASPLWSIYHVKVLGLNNTQISELGIAASISGLVLLPFWGKLLDKVSNKKIFVFSSFLISTLPVLYVLNRSFYYLVFVQLIIGIIGYGYDVILQNNLMESARKMKHDYAYMADYQIYVSVTRMVFPPIGILLYSHLNIVNAFLIIGGFRLFAAVASLFGMREEAAYETNLESARVL